MQFVTFFMACNPPLTPKGVEFVFNQLQIHSINLVEITYDPAGPWLECTAMHGSDHTLANFLKCLLTSVVNEDTGAFDADPDVLDVEIERDRITHWCTYRDTVLKPQGKVRDSYLNGADTDLQMYPKKASSVILTMGDYDVWRYPDIFHQYRFKATWNRLREDVDYHGLTLRQMLGPGCWLTWVAKHLEKVSGAVVSYNYMEDMVYLGSSNEGDIEMAIAKLKRLLQTAANFRVRLVTNQFILPPESKRSWMVDVRKAHEIGLARGTFLRHGGNLEETRKAYSDLYVNRCILTYRLREGSLSRINKNCSESRTPAGYPRPPFDKSERFRPFVNAILTKKVSWLGPGHADIRSYSLPPTSTTPAVPPIQRPPLEFNPRPNCGVLSWVNSVPGGTHEDEIGAKVPPLRPIEDGTDKSSGFLIFSELEGSSSKTPSRKFNYRSILDGDGQGTELATQITDVADDDAYASLGMLHPGGSLAEPNEKNHSRTMQDNHRASTTLSTTTQDLMQLSDSFEALAASTVVDRSTCNDLLGPDRNLYSMLLPQPLIPNLPTPAPGAYSSGSLMPRVKTPEPGPEYFHTMNQNAPAPGSKFYAQHGGQRSRVQHSQRRRGQGPRVRGGKSYAQACCGNSRSASSSEREKYPGDGQRSLQRGSNSKNPGISGQSPGNTSQSEHGSVISDRTASQLSQSPSHLQGQGGSGSRPGSNANSRGSNGSALSVSFPARSRMRNADMPIQDHMAMNSQLEANWLEGNFAPLSRGHQVIAKLEDLTERTLKTESLFIQGMEEKLARMVELARGHAGEVSLKIIFCRIMLSNVFDNAINDKHVEELSYLPEQMLRRLAAFPNRDVHITHILSPYGADANKISQLPVDQEGSKWTLEDTAIYYDIHCYSPMTRSEFTVRIDAKTFEYTFEDGRNGPEELHRHAYIHCPGKAWDLEAVLKTTDISFFKEMFGCSVEKIIETFAVSDNVSLKAPVFSFKFPCDAMFKITAIRVRSVARYIDVPHRNAFLNITMVRDTRQTLEKAVSTNQLEHILTSPSTNRWDNGGLMNVWYEASVTSRRLENMFAENREMEFGEDARWSSEALKTDGTLVKLLWPAMYMITSLDVVGENNDNMMCPKVLQAQGSGICAGEEDTPKHVSFW